MSRPHMADDKPMNVRDTAAALGVSEQTIRNWADKGLLRAVRLPRSGYRRFDHADIQRMRDEMWSQFAPATTLDMGEKTGETT